jgi:hypothetical protein
LSNRMALVAAIPFVAFTPWNDKMGAC